MSLALVGLPVLDENLKLNRALSRSGRENQLLPATTRTSHEMTVQFRVPAGVAQLDRAPVYETGGWRFESSHSRFPASTTNSHLPEPVLNGLHTHVCA